MEETLAAGAIVIPPGPRLGDVVMDVKDLGMGVDGRVLFDALSFTVGKRSRVGIVGANGSGKTTLFRILSGELVATSGSVRQG